MATTVDAPTQIFAPELASIYANTANHGHHLIGEHREATFEEAVKVGNALIEAQSELRSQGQTTYWLLWLQQNVEFSAHQARQYMQVAKRAYSLRKMGVQGMQEAMTIINAEKMKATVSLPMRREMAKMAETHSITEVAAEFDISVSTASHWVAHERWKEEPTPVVRRSHGGNIRITDAVCAVLHDALRTYEWHGSQTWPNSSNKDKEALRVSLIAALEIT